MRQVPNRPVDYHFLYLAPGASVDFFFTAARRYWERFQPVVIYDLAVVQHTPENALVVLTALARSDTAEITRQMVISLFGERLYLDLLVYDYVEDMQLTLDSRAERNEPYGVPLIP